MIKSETIWKASMTTMVYFTYARVLDMSVAEGDEKKIFKAVFTVGKFGDGPKSHKTLIWDEVSDKITIKTP